MASSLILPQSSRRAWLRGAGKATLSAVAISLIAGCDSMAADKKMAADPAADVDILNTALAL